MSVLTISNSKWREAANLERLLVGNSEPMRDLEQEILIAAGGEIAVLITGETGAGKELVAQEIHRRCDRAGGPFIAVNCGSLTESLLETRLFGHVKGAFTGASGARSGLFEAADGGTIFLDEIGDMVMPLQVYLLRVLQERKVMPVGSHTERRVDVRVIAATNKELPREVKEGRFRQDLYYRLTEFPIRVPALRERPSDIPLLVRHFLGTMEIEEGALDLLCGYHWPGNVRELKATVKRLTLRAGAQGAVVITTEQARREIRLREEVMAADVGTDRDPRERRDPITCANKSCGGDSFEKRVNQDKLAYYQELVRSSGGRAKAAQQVGLTYSALYHRMERLRRQVEEH
jgi:transcriptional regulator with GAF, ATPase, and Fis domain